MDKLTNPDVHPTPAGEFTDGDPINNIPRTLLTAEWPNMFQRELINLVEGAGLQLNGADFTQVLQAVVKLSHSNGFETGDVKFSYRPAPSAGWLLIDGRTIGSASSAATALAGAEAHDLYVFLWENFDNTLCPVQGGRGAAAEDDWAADKTIQLFDDRGEHYRIWDNGRGIDAGRVLGSWQADQIKEHDHDTRITADANSADDGSSPNDADYTNSGAWGYKTGKTGGPENRVRTRAINVFIKL